MDDEDYERYLRLLAGAVRRYRWLCLSYCLMPNHVHLVIETPEPNLGVGMRWFHGEVGRAFNDRHDRVGHLFERRFWSDRIRDDDQLVIVTGYVVLNPVAGGLCERPEDWDWGSHAHLTNGHTPEWLAYGDLLGRLDGIAGPCCYDDVVEARLRARRA